MSKNSLLNDLNPQQRDAVLHTKGPLLILAGAGSGKTKVITYRFAHLASAQKVSPASILAMTFTNKAAGEMRGRIETLMNRSLKGLWIGTFHALSNRILRKEIDRLGFHRDFVIYDDDDSNSLVRSILKEFKMHEAIYKGIASRISSMKAALIGPNEFLNNETSLDFDEKFARVYVRYQDELKKNNALDFDDLIMDTVRLFEEHPAVLKKYNKEISHIMVDEFQDTNTAQYRLSRLLAGEHQNLCVVGDDDQSIYRFRGADVRNIMSFEKDFPSARVIKLEQNYRSTQVILDAAGGVISQNPVRKLKKLWTEKNEGEKLYYCVANSENDEARYIAKSIRELYLKGKYSYSDFAVLYRMNLQARALEEALRVYGMPYRIIGGISFYHRREVKDIISYLKVINNPKDSVSLKRIINCPPRGIGDTTTARIENEAKKKNKSFFDAMKSLSSSSDSAALKEKISDFIEIIDELTAKRGMAPPQLIQLVLEKTGYIKWVEKERIENITEIIRMAEGMNLQELIDAASLFSGADERVDSNCITLMTLHSAKGLEFPVVFIAGVENGLLPHFHAMQNPEELHEERRLFYVGITRAKDILILSSAKKRRLYSSIQELEPSSFLSEIPSGCYFYTGMMPIPMVESVPRITPKRLRTVDFSPPSIFLPGVRVKHPKWGIGVVRDSYGETDDVKVMVNFSTVGVKRLSLKFANLERL